MPSFVLTWKLSTALIAGAFGVLGLIPSTLAQGAAWPQRPVKIIVPAPAGSSLDIVARLLAEKLKDRWGQPVVVEPKPGAGGLLGVDQVAKATDGHTLVIGFPGPTAYAPFLYKKMPYDPVRDLAPIVLTTTQPNVLAVNANLPVKTVQELIQWAKANPGKLSYASVGNGSSSHLSMELLKSEAGFEAQHVPFNGAPPAALSVANGDTQVLFAVASGIAPHVQAGRIRPIAVTSLNRFEPLKELPTIHESGVRGFEAIAWNGLFGPASLPAEVILKISADVNAVLALDEVRQRILNAGMAPGGGTVAAFKSIIEADMKKWGAIIKRLGVQLD
ncbi:MAG: tripartite tricarboxylate transporter substrate binding protein [Casimicrobiaceae bacterium]|nr:tripartite tricarboxylate transporter substrate binding protein [Casimicrobiaceae bacterium]MCX8099167.1 tripartite tricarboxylate transporter substrate binding protein [Casimicrobiaceae bacterium]